MTDAVKTSTSTPAPKAETPDPLKMKITKDEEPKPPDPKAPHAKSEAPPATLKASYKLLKEHPEIPIGICSQILPNKMQCWRAGDVLVQEGETSYQLCSRHAVAKEQGIPLD